MSLRKRIEKLEAAADEPAPARSMWDVLYDPKSPEEFAAYWPPEFFERPPGPLPVEALLARLLPPLGEPPQPQS